MRQLSLFHEPTSAKRLQSQLDAESEELLLAFRTLRLSSGMSTRSVSREVSQLRSVARESGISPLRALFSDLVAVAGVLREPRASISRSTARARLLAVQRFIAVIGPKLGRDAVVDLATLDGLLPSRSVSGWHTAGTLVAGVSGRRRRRGPTLSASDLERIVDAAADISAGRADRDRALVALHCFTGLRPEEVVGLRWQDITSEIAPGGRYGLMVTVERRGMSVRLPLLGLAGDAVRALAWSTGGTIGTLSGPVFRTGRGSDRTMSYRAARDVVGTACLRAGLPAVEAAELRSACAYWLHARGLSAHEVAAVLGIARVRTVDRLLERHLALDAQRRAREVLGGQTE